MTYDPHKRDGSWQMIRPGLYIDPAGYGHVFPDEVIAELSRLYPEIPWNYETDYEITVQAIRDSLREAGCTGEIKIIQHEREEN